MFFELLNRKLTMSLGLIALAGIICVELSGCYSDNCCAAYTPEYSDSHNGRDDAYEQMCYNTMTFDDKYNKDAACSLKEVDRYVEAALACCAPLKSEMEYIEFEKEDLESNNSLGIFSIQIVLNSIPYCDEVACAGVLVPTNAYTQCLFNTHPRTYKCDIPAAQQYETDLNQCCMNASDKKSCVRSFVMNEGGCLATCCEGLPDQDNDQYISKENCLKVLNSSNECIETPIDACCRIAPKETSPGHIDRDTCKYIFTKTKGQCVNTDEKYEIYKNQSE